MVSVRRINPRVITQTHRSLLRENRTKQWLKMRVGCSSIRGAYCLRLKSGEQTDDADSDGDDGDDGDNGAQNAAGNQVVFDGHKCSLRTSLSTVVQKSIHLGHFAFMHSDQLSQHAFWRTSESTGPYLLRSK